MKNNLYRKETQREEKFLKIFPLRFFAFFAVNLFLLKLMRNR